MTAKPMLSETDHQLSPVPQVVATATVELDEVHIEPTCKSGLVTY